MNRGGMTDEFAEGFLQNLNKLWLVPEVERRLKAGSLTSDSPVWGVQVIMENGIETEVRLNDEVNGIFSVGPSSGIPEGTQVAAANAQQIASNLTGFEMEIDDRPNAAHVTALFGENWYFFVFDFRYNAAVIADLITIAREFMETARETAKSKRMRAFVANLHVAVESLAKARLVVHSDNSTLESKKHGYLKGRYNLHSKHNDADRQFSALLNRLDELRNDARYSTESFTFPEVESSEMLSTCETMLEQLMSVVPVRTHRLLAGAV